MSEINPAVPPAMERVVAKAVEKRTEMRYQSALEMAQDLQRALQEPDGTWLGRLPDVNTVSDEMQGMAYTQRQNKTLFRRKKWITWALFGLAVCAVIFGLIEGALLIYDRVVNTAEAPYLLDETEENALRLIDRAELRAEIYRKSDEVKPAGIVIMQSPEDGTTMKKNETVYITVSTGPEEQPVPRVAGMNVSQARTELEKYGFTLLVLPQRVLSEAEWDTVITQSPEDGVTLPSGSVIQVTLSGGQVTLPNLVDMQRDEAMLLIQQMKLSLTEIKEIPVDDVTKAEHVAAQQYTDGDLKQYMPGDQVMQQTQVTLAVYVAQPALENPEGNGGADEAENPPSEESEIQ